MQKVQIIGPERASFWLAPQNVHETANQNCRVKAPEFGKRAKRKSKGKQGTGRKKPQGCHHTW
jgi:hypothetical protein